MHAGITENVTCTWPATVSFKAGVTPLYGTCRMSTDVIDFRISMDKCGGEPDPPEPYLSCPGFDFASATSSLIELADTAAFATSRNGVEAMRLTGAKSLMRS